MSDMKKHSKRKGKNVFDEDIYIKCPVRRKFNFISM